MKWIGIFPSDIKRYGKSQFCLGVHARDSFFISFFIYVAYLSQTHNPISQGSQENTRVQKHVKRITGLGVGWCTQSVLK